MNNILISFSGSTYNRSYTKITLNGTTYISEEEYMFGTLLYLKSNVVYNETKDILYSYLSFHGNYDDVITNNMFENNTQTTCMILKDPFTNISKENFFNDANLRQTYLLSNDLVDDEDFSGHSVISKVSNDGNLMITMYYDEDVRHMRLIDLSSGKAKLIAAYN